LPCLVNILASEKDGLLHQVPSASRTEHRTCYDETLQGIETNSFDKSAQFKVTEWLRIRFVDRISEAIG